MEGADQFLKRVFLGKDEHIAEKLTNLRKLTEREQSMVTVLTLPIATHTPSQIDGAMVFLENANENTSSISNRSHGPIYLCYVFNDISNGISNRRSSARKEWHIPKAAAQNPGRASSK